MRVTHRRRRTIIIIITHGTGARTEEGPQTDILLSSILTTINTEHWILPRLYMELDITLVILQVFIFEDRWFHVIYRWCKLALLRSTVMHELTLVAIR